MEHMRVGNRFASYDEFMEMLTLFSLQNCVQFWKREARKIENQYGKVSRVEYANPKLVYYSLKMCCIHGGRKYQKNKTYKGERQRTTMKQDCEAHIRLKLSEDAQYLEIFNINLKHNHPVTESLCTALPPKKLTYSSLNAVSITKQLAKVASESSGIYFERRIKLLDDLLRYWKAGKDVELSVLNNETNKLSPVDAVADFVIIPADVAIAKKYWKDGKNFEVSHLDNEKDKLTNELTPVDTVSDFIIVPANVASAKKTIPGTSSVVSEGKVKDIMLSKPIKRSKPEDFDSSVACLSRKQHARKQPSKFKDLSLLARQKKTLMWFVDQELAERTIENGGHIDIDEIEPTPAKVSSACKNANIFIVRPFFTEDAWNLLLSIVTLKKELSIWHCGVCDSSCYDSSTVQCDSCLNLYHNDCVVIVRLGQENEFYCSKCCS